MKRPTTEARLLGDHSRVAMQKLRSQLAEIAGQVQYGKRPVVVTNYSRDAFALIPMEYLAILEEALEERADHAAAERAMDVLNDADDEVLPYVPPSIRRQRQKA